MNEKSGFPCISVLVPVYNAGNYLKECIESVIHQTYNNLEIILVDDGSTDGSGELCDAYAEQDKRIHVIHKENSGTVDTRKMAAKNATGMYCACLDSDDWISQDYFEKIAQVIMEYKPDMVCCGFIKANETTQVEYPVGFRKGYYTEAELAADIMPCCLARKDGYTFPINLWAKAYKTELYQQMQELVEPGCKSSEDLGCAAPLLYICQSLYIMDECLYFYRYNPNSVCNVRRGNPWDQPRAVEKTLSKTINMNMNDYQEQLMRRLFMEVYNVVATHMKRDETYLCIAKEVRNYLNDSYTKNIVLHCNFSESKSYTIKKYMLKYKMILPIFIWFRKRWNIPLH